MRIVVNISLSSGTDACPGADADWTDPNVKTNPNVSPLTRFIIPNCPLTSSQLGD